MRNRLFPLLLVFLLAGVGSAQETKETEKRLQTVRRELNQVAAERRKLEDQRGDASRKLREVDERVGGASKSLKQTQLLIQHDETRLQVLQQERSQLARDLTSKKAELARLLRAAQAHQTAHPLKELLVHDDVAKAEQIMTYQGYLQRAQTQRIQQLSSEIARVESVEAEIVQRRESLAAAKKQQQQELQRLQTTRQERNALIADLDKRYQDRSAREKALGQDAKALQALLTQLRNAAAKAAKAKAESQRQAQGAANTTASKRAAAAPRPAALRVGGLSWPVSGNLLASFAGKLPDGQRSDGVLIAAPAGTTVKAVADGRVVFADWMTGYGMILIVDHGNNYMSLYAHNEGFLKNVGDSVKHGDALATVGSSGGHDVPALYFELRHRGAPVNPAAWLSRQ
jgi:murein hydrolase activator